MPAPTSEFKKSKIISLYEEGLSSAKISRQMGVAKSTVTRIVRMAGKSRTVSDGVRLANQRRQTPRKAHNRLDLAGKVFGRLTVEREHGTAEHPGGSSHSTWFCKCSCGGFAVAYGTSLTSGQTNSCGCLNSERLVASNLTHGQTGTRTYRIWMAMRNRCRFPDQPMYHRYGGRGIKVCGRWESFENFLSDMGEAPPDHQIDRIDNDGDYTPSNCRWATRSQQARNKATNRVISFRGQSKPLCEWAEELEMDQSSLRERLEKWPLERALTEPRNR